MHFAACVSWSCWITENCSGWCLKNWTDWKTKVKKTEHRKEGNAGFAWCIWYWHRRSNRCKQLLLKTRPDISSDAHVMTDHSHKHPAEQMLESRTSWEYVCYFLRILESKRVQRLLTPSSFSNCLSFQSVYTSLHFHPSTRKIFFFGYSVLFTFALVSPSIIRRLSGSSTCTRSSCYEAN